MLKKREINKVFTPKTHDVNKKMYINRVSLEKELKRKINGFKHIIMYGDSGCGKSWLYKKVLSDERIKYSMVNLANAKRFKGITNLFKLEISEKYEKTKYSDTIKAEANAVIAKGNLEHQNIYEVREEDPLKKYIEEVNKGKDIIVLENLELYFHIQIICKSWEIY